MTSLLAVDWGTSSFRLMHLDTQGNVLAQVATNFGVSTLNKSQLEPYLRDQIVAMDENLLSLPIVLCGMVGSTIGWQEAGYTSCPVDPKALSAELFPIHNTDLNAQIAPGLKTLSPLGQADFMRGEETQVVGWMASQPEQDQQTSLLCLPGTHSKWVQVTNGVITNFATAFTGELFACLNNHGILINGPQQEDEAAFMAGLQASEQSPSLIHLLFSTRSRMLEGLHAQENCRAYLSGLLIGSEIRASLDQWQGFAVVDLIGGDSLTRFYKKALNYYQIQARMHAGDEMSAKGLWHLYQSR